MGGRAGGWTGGPACRSAGSDGAAPHAAAKTNPVSLRGCCSRREPPDAHPQCVAACKGRRLTPSLPACPPRLPARLPACFFACRVLQEDLTPFAQQCISEMAPKFRMELFQVGAGYFESWKDPQSVGERQGSDQWPVEEVAVAVWDLCPTAVRRRSSSLGRSNDLNTSCHRCLRLRPLPAGA
jgi:hypothetical protein